MVLHLPRQNFIWHYLGWSFSLLRSSWRASPSALVLPTNSFVLSLKFLTSLLISSCISLLWLPSPAHISAFSLLSPLQRLTMSFRFLHLDPSSFMFVICSLPHPEKPYSFVLYFATWLWSRQTELYQTSSVWRETVPAARTVVRERRDRTGCSCQANELIFRNFQNYSWCHFYFLKAIENKVVGFVNRKKRIYCPFLTQVVSQSLDCFRWFSSVQIVSKPSSLFTKNRHSFLCLTWGNTLLAAPSSFPVSGSCSLYNPATPGKALCQRSSAPSEDFHHVPAFGW